LRIADAATSLYGIIGRPVRHSLSPAMHNAAFEKTGINAVYLAFETDSAEAACHAMRCLGIKGYSVTIPNKESIMQFLDDIDETALEIGAVNTVKNDDGRLSGTNTDWIGAVNALGVKGGVRGKRAVVIGAGGSARAVVYGLVREGADVSVFNRTIERARRLAEEFGCAYAGLDGLDDAEGDIMVNTTSVGMSPNDDKMPVTREQVGRFSLVMDIVYSPLETMLLKTAKGLGVEVVYGLDMLLYQAVGQFEYWTGMRAPVDAMREALEHARRS